ncbi:hypothetical protein FI667_g1455, partial [Globisporangium splendens]
MGDGRTASGKENIHGFKWGKQTDRFEGFTRIAYTTDANTEDPARGQQQRGDANDQRENDDEGEEEDEEDDEEDEEGDLTQTIVDMGRHACMQWTQKLQMVLEASHRKLTTIRDERFASEDQLDDWKENLSQKKLQVQKNKSHLYKAQSELDSLNATLRQVEKYNEEMKNEIARTQRAAQKAEETMANMEKDQVKQDLYIDSLNEQIESLHEKITMTIAQHKSQKFETAAAEETLHEATAQMEAIAFEKKQLLQQWKGSLIGIQQRDQALLAAQTAISAVDEEDLALASEIRGYKQSIEKAQAQHETLVGTIERFNTEIRFVEEQIASLRQEHDRLSERYDMLAKSLRQTEVQTAKVSGETKKLELDTTQVQQHLETTQRERHGLEDQVSAQKNEQTTANKAAHNLTEEAQHIQGVVHTKEIALASLKNEMARVSVDILNVQAHVPQLEETQEKLVAELKQEDIQVEKLELEIRQHNDEIEKEMLRLDRLNKKYEHLLSKMENENTGPLEGMIKNLIKETSDCRVPGARRKESGAQEQDERARAKATAAAQRLRRDAEDIKELKANINGMHNDTVKLNELIAKNSGRQEELLNMNHGLEMEFKCELKELEGESIQMEQLAATLKSEKQDILDRIVEVERQIMLWEKKIQLEKETQAALDPEVGQTETKSMEKEIHRMRLRLEALQRNQEQILQGMEQAIHKRDLIAMRGRSKKDTELTYASLTTKVSTLRNDLRKTEKGIVKMDKTIKQKVVSCEDISFQLEKVTAELKVDEERGMSLQKGINNALYEKQRYIDAEARKLRLAKRFESMCKSISSNSQQDDARARDELEKSQRAIEKIKQIIEKLQQQSPHLNEVLSRVLMLADEPPV